MIIISAYMYTDGADSSSCSYCKISILLRQSADGMNILFMWMLYVAHEVCCYSNDLKVLFNGHVELPEL